MKKLLLFLSVALLLSSCSSYNKIINSQDEFKNLSSTWLRQSIKAYSEAKKTKHFHAYNVKLKYYHSVNESKDCVNELEICLKTLVCAKDMEQVLYMKTDDEIHKYEPINYVSKLYTQSSSSTTTIVSTEAREGDTEDDDPDNDKPVVTTNTDNKTSNSTDTYQLMSMKIHFTSADWDKIMKAEKLEYRIYFGNEGVDIPVKTKDLNKLKKFVSSFRIHEN